MTERADFAGSSASSTPRRPLGPARRADHLRRRADLGPAPDEDTVAARRWGFRRFVLQTNGVYLTRPELLKHPIALGVKTYLSRSTPTGPPPTTRSPEAAANIPAPWRG